MDSMPDLVSVSDSEDSAFVLLTPPNSFCSMDSDTDDKGSLQMLSDDGMEGMVEDRDEDGITTGDAAMLVNVNRVEGFHTELYNSGADKSGVGFMKFQHFYFYASDGLLESMTFYFIEVEYNSKLYKLVHFLKVKCSL